MLCQLGRIRKFQLLNPINKFLLALIELFCKINPDIKIELHYYFK